MSTLKVNNLQVGQDGTAANNYTLYQPASPDGTVRLGYGVAGSVTDILTLKNSNLGIGTNNPTTESGFTKVLHVYDDSPQVLLEREAGSGDVKAGFNAWSGNASLETFTATPLRIRTSGNTNQIYLSTNGSVGIDTNSPSDKLSIVAAPNSLVLGAKDSTRGNHIFQLLADDSAGNGELRLYQNSGSGTHLKTVEIASSGNSYFTGGNVGIGTDNPSSTLQVGLNPNNGSGAGVSAGSNGALKMARTNDADQLIEGYKVGDSSPNFVVRADGRIGAGTNSPNTELEIQSATDPKIRLQSQESGNKRLELWIDGGEAIGYIAADQSASQLAFRTTNTERLRIASNGQVLIGDYNTHSSIHGNLEVNGNDGINISNSYRTGTNGVQWRLIPHNGGSGQSPSNLRLYEGASGTEVINITKTGRIGVNRMTPSFMLDIIGNSSTGANCIRITDGAETGHGSHPAKIVAGGTYYHEMQMHSRRFAVHTYDGSNIAERFRVHQTGQVLLGTQSPLNTLPGIQMYLSGADPTLIGCKADNNPAAYVTLLKLAGYSQSSSSFRENAAILFETNTNNNAGNASGRILFRTEGLNETNGPSTRAVITAEGKMGIGIEDPSGILDVKSTQTSSLKTFLRLGDSGNGGSYFDFNMSDQSSGADEISHRKDGYVSKNTYGLKISSHSTLTGSYTTAGPASIRWYFPSAGGGNQAGGQLEFWTNQNGYAGTSETKKMQIDNYGNIGAPSGNNIYNASDERLKENIVNLTGCLEKVKQLRPISFTWKDGFGMMSGVSEYGFGAQTTQAVDEILVEPFGEDDIVLDEETIENPLRVNDKYIVPMLVKAVQEQQEQIEALQALVNSLTSSD